MKEIKTVSLIGLGAIGSYFAWNLGPVLGDNFRIIAGGERKKRLEKDGIIINGEQYYFNIVDPEEKVEPADLVIVITKFNALDTAAKDIRNHVGKDTLIMAPLNGVESEEILARTYGFDNIIYSVTRVSVLMDGNKTTFNPNLARIEYGEKTNEVISERVQRINDLFDKTHINSLIQPDMVYAMWHKYMCNLAENQGSALLGVPFGAWNGKSEHATALREMIMWEVIEVAKKKGIIFTEADVKKQGHILTKVAYNNKSSTLQDLEAKRKTEIDMLSGTFIRIAKEVGVPAPINEFLYHSIKVLEEKNEGKI
ncbi:MAG: ketopantoate reductase family protein [Fusobacteriaceae bacterium]|jgi:2-dehydropantoate 2-reductase|nr:ketopantoate reductase family protein [Fusobacteriaceae bacterium]